MPRSILVSVLLLASLVDSAGQSVIFDDDFSTMPAANGWTRVVATTGTAIGTIGHTGSTVSVEKVPPGAGRVTGSITRTVSTVGFESIQLQIAAFQSGTNFEGSTTPNPDNIDDLSVFIDSGSGFVPLFSRQGVWATTSAGTIDGGTGPGTTVSTSSGFIGLSGAAGNNSGLQVRISATISANAEAYFFDQFTIRGTPILVPIRDDFDSGAPPAMLLVTPFIGTHPEPEPILLIEDLSAIASVYDSGFATLAALPEAHLTAARAATRDVNGRLFRLRSGLGIGEMGTPERRSHGRGQSISETPIEKLDSGVGISGFELYAAGDLGQTEQDPIGDLSAFDGETLSSTVGAEWTVFDQFSAGLGWTYLENDTAFGGDLGHADLDGHALSAYGSWVSTNGGLYATAMYSHAQIDNHLTRNTGLGHDALSVSESESHLIDAEIGYQFCLGEDRSVITGPILGIDWVSGEIASFSETGRFARGLLNVEDLKYESLVSRLGWSISTQIPAGKATLIPQLRAAWEHEFEGADETARATLQESPFRFVQGNRFLGHGGDFTGELSQSRPGQDYLSAGAGLQIEFGSWSIGFDYEGVFFRSHQSSHFASARVAAEF